ncbi:MAG: YjbH domain-containing protein [Synergistaceae bacterium]|nr:YjbH domain-containing protein [Synergistaceae bacterium]
MRKIFNCLLILIFLVYISTQASALTSGNTGLTGLWEYPTAEMPEDGAGRFGYTYNSPYNFYFIDLSWLPWLEINARLTTFDTIQTGGRTNHERRYMDKAIDLKFILWHTKNPDNWIIPSLAVGVVDMMGTELMKAYYGVATWRIGKVAATLGYGSDRFNGLFAGIEWDVADWFTLKAEYSPLDYDQDMQNGEGKSRAVKSLPSQKFNVGAVLRSPWGLQGSVSYQRGSEWAFTVSQKIHLGGPIIGDGRKKFNAPGDFRCANWEDTESQDLIAKIKSGIEKYVRVRDVVIKLEESEDENGGQNRNLSLSYENYGYASHAEAMARLLIVLSAVMPETDSVTLIAKNASVPIVKAEFPGSLLFDLRARSLREKDAISSAVFSWASEDVKAPDKRVLASKAEHEFKAMLVYEPRIDQTLDRAYMDRLNIDAIYNGRYRNGWGATVDVRFPIYNDIDTDPIYGLWWEPDLNDNIRLQQAAMTYASHIGNSGRFWVFGEGGYLDEEWFGGNLWARYYGESGIWWIGARAAIYHDRDPWSFARFSDGRLMYRGGRAVEDKNEKEWINAQWLQAGLNFPSLNLDLQIDYGWFVDYDRGWKISATRHWDDTAVGFWYIDTDINAPDKSFTKAGVHMEIPADKWFGTWFGNSSSHVWEQNTNFLSTWRMHSGRDGGIVRTPERFMSQLRPVLLKQNVERMIRDYCTYDESTDGEGDNEVRSILEYIFH